MVVWGDGVHPVLRSVLEAKARLAAGLRIAFALLCMFANELRATLARVVYSAALAAFALIVVEITAPRGGSGRARTPTDWIEVIQAAARLRDDHPGVRERSRAIRSGVMSVALGARMS